jgi:hypothetical protein
VGQPGHGTVDAHRCQHRASWGAEYSVEYGSGGRRYGSIARDRPAVGIERSARAQQRHEHDRAAKHRGFCHAEPPGRSEASGSDVSPWRGWRNSSFLWRSSLRRADEARFRPLAERPLLLETVRRLVLFFLSRTQKPSQYVDQQNDSQDERADDGFRRHVAGFRWVPGGSCSVSAMAFRISVSACTFCIR